MTTAAGGQHTSVPPRDELDPAGTDRATVAPPAPLERVGPARRILFGCHGVPFSIDANAWAYNLFERMRRDAALDVVYVNLITAADAFFFRYACGDDFQDPRRLGNVRGCTIEGPVQREQPALAELIRASAPDLLVAWGITAAVLLHQAASDLPLILVACESRQLAHLIEAGAVRDAVSFQCAVEQGVRFPRPSEDDPEVVALRRCDLLIVPSAQTQFAFGHFFSSLTGKMYARPLSPADLVADEVAQVGDEVAQVGDEVGQFADLRRPFAERDVDVLLADGDWRPRVKNFALASRIASRLGDVAVHIVGEHHEHIRGVHVHGLPRHRRDLYALLGRTKVLACPALADVGPGVLFEASAMGCNVVTSANRGYAELCCDELRSPGGGVPEFVERIRRGISRPFDDNRAAFNGSTTDLVETLSVF